MTTQRARGSALSGEKGKRQDLLHPGAVVIRARMIGFPKVLRGEGQPFGDWSLVLAVDALDLEDDLRRAGWQFFVMEPAVHAWRVGLDPNAALARALRKAVSVVEGENLNALEIRSVSFRRFLGTYIVRLTGVCPPGAVEW